MRKDEENKKESTENIEEEHLEGMDGYYFTGHVNKQTLQDNKDPVGELDQYALRNNHSVSENYHGPPEYSLEESWRDWDKFSNDDFSKEAGPYYRDHAHDNSKKEIIRNLLNDTLEIENLSITLIGPNVFVSGQAKTHMSKEQITELIMSVGDIHNVVNHIMVKNLSSTDEGPHRVIKQDLGLDGGMYEA